MKSFQPLEWYQWAIDSKLWMDWTGAFKNYGAYTGKTSYCTNIGLRDTSFSKLYKLVEETKLKLIHINTSPADTVERDDPLILADHSNLVVVNSSFRSNYSTVEIFSYDKVNFKLIEQVKDFLPSKEKAAKVSVYIFTFDSKEGPRFDKVGGIGKKLITTNYTDEVLTKYDKVVDTLLDDYTGNALILEGPPGTGKSYFIRGLVEEFKQAKFFFIPGSNAGDVTSPIVVRLLSDFGSVPKILILEDGDGEILERVERTSSNFSGLLNLTDGILGQALNARVIISTNVPKVKLDKAIMRPGRLNNYINIQPFKLEQAKVVYKNLSGKELPSYSKKTEYTLAELYALNYEVYTHDTEVEKEGNYL